MPGTKAKKFLKKTFVPHFLEVSKAQPHTSKPCLIISHFQKLKAPTTDFSCRVAKGYGT